MRASAKACEVWRELDTTPSSCVLRSFSASMSWATVEPVPTPSTIPASMYARAASAARRFFSTDMRNHLPQKQLCPLTRAQLITFEGLLFLSGLFISYLLLRLLCFRCHDRNHVIGLVRGPSIYTNN